MRPCKMPLNPSAGAHRDPQPLQKDPYKEANNPKNSLNFQLQRVPLYPPLKRITYCFLHEIIVFDFSIGT